METDQAELSLSATNLLDLDIVSKSDPMAVVYLKKRDGNLQELGRTEVILNNLNPSWIGKIPVAYQFEMVQPLVIHIYDIDTKYHNIPVKALNLRDQDFIGEANCALSEIFTKRDRTLTLKLHNRTSKNVGMLNVHAEETVSSRNAAKIVFRCSNLDNVDLLSKSDPFLRISRKVESGSSIPICKTEVVNNNLNPTWRPVCLTTQQFTSKESSTVFLFKGFSAVAVLMHSRDNPLIIECFDFNSNGNHTLLGNLQTSISALQNLHGEKPGMNFVKPQRGHEKAEAAIVRKIMSGNWHSSLLKKLACCLASLPRSKGDEGSWSLMMQKILLSLSALFVSALEGLEEDSTRSKPVTLLVPPGKIPPPHLGGQMIGGQAIDSEERSLPSVISVISCLMQCCCTMLTSSYQVQENVGSSDAESVVKKLQTDGRYRWTIGDTCERCV